MTIKLRNIVLTCLLYLLLGLNYLHSSNQIVLQKFNQTDANHSNLSFSIIDSVGKFYNIKDSSSLILNENFILVPNKSLTKIGTVQKKSIDIVFSFSISGSMAGKDIELVKNGVNYWASIQDTSNIRSALQGYNYNSFLFADFNNKLKNSLGIFNFLQCTGASNFDASLIKEKSSALNLFNNSTANKKVVILFTNGSSEATIDSIIKKARINNISVYSITLNLDTPNNLQTITDSTYGNSFSSITDIQSLNEILAEIYLDIIESPYYNLTWKNLDCQNSINVNLKIKENPLYIENSKKYIKPDSNYNIIIDKNYFDFGVIKNGKIDSTIFQIQNKGNDKVYINSINIDNNHFTINQIKESDSIESLSKLKFSIKFTPIDTSLIYCNIEIRFNNCESIKIKLKAGSDNISTSNKLIEILSPNENSILIGGIPTTVQLSSAIRDSIICSISTNNMQNWKTISSLYNNSQFSLVPDNIESNQSFLKIDLKNKDNHFENIKYINHNLNSFDKIVWNYNGNFLIVASTPFIKLIDAKNGSSKILATNTNEIYSLNASPVSNKIAIAYQSPDLSNNELIVWDISDTTNPDPKKYFGAISKQISTAWTSDGTRLASSDIIGNINIWDLNNPIKTLISKKISNSRINQLAFLNNSNDTLISVGDDKILRILYIKTLETIDSLPINSNVLSLTLSKDNSQLGILFGDQTIYQFGLIYVNGKSHLVSNSPINRDSTDIIKKIVYNQNKNQIIISTQNYIQILNYTTGKPLFLFNLHKNNINDFTLLNDSLIASGGNDKEIYIWNCNQYPFKQKQIFSDTSDKFAIEKFNVTLKNMTFPDFCINNQLDSSFSNAIFNNNSNSILIDSINISGNDESEFESYDKFPKVIPSLSLLHLNLIFKPRTEGFKKAKVNLYAGVNIITSDLNGRGINSNVTSSVNKIDFSYQLIGKQKDSLLILLVNSSNDPINIVKTEINNNLDNAFKINSNPGFQLKANEKKSITISFLPVNELVYNASLLFYPEQFCSPVIIYLSGIGKKIEYKIDSLISMNDIRCNNSNLNFDLNIINTGYISIPIDSWEIIPSYLQISSQLTSDNIAPFENRNYKFIISNPQMIKDSFYIKFNSSVLNSSPMESKIKLKVINSKIELLDTSLNFIDLPLNTQDTKILKIKNIGNQNENMNINLFSQYFEIIEISPKILKPDSICMIYIRFKGSSNEIQTDTNFIFKDSCLNSYKIHLIANTINTSPIFSFPNSVEYGYLECIEPKILSLKLYNLSPIVAGIIDSVRITPNNLIKFKQDSNSIRINKNDSINLILDYHPIANGNFNFSIFIYSKSLQINPQKINISFNQLNNQYKLETDSLYIGSSIINKKIQSQTKITNLSPNFQFKWVAMAVNVGDFVIDSISPLILNYNQSGTIYISFKSNSQDSIFNNSYDFTDYCGNSNRLKFSAKQLNNNYAKLKFDKQIDSFPSSKYASVQINLDTNRILFNQEDTISFRLNYNPKVIYFNNQNNSGIIQTKKKNFPLILNIITLLGDTDYTELRIDSIYCSNKNIFIVFDSSAIIKITNIDTSFGNKRFLNLTDSLYLNVLYPKSIDDNYITIKYGLIEEGNSNISIYDIMGNLVEEVVSTNKKESNQLKYEFKSIMPGTYFILLRTPSNILISKVIILY